MCNFDAWCTVLDGRMNSTRFSTHPDIRETDNFHNNETAGRRYKNWGTDEDTYIIKSESATKIEDFAFNLHHFTQLRNTTRSERTLICFSDFKSIKIDITNVFNQIIILYTTTTTLQLDASWLQYMSTPWRWPSHEPKRVGGKRIVRVSWKILWNS